MSQILTKTFYLNDMSTRKAGQHPWTDLGYSLTIPWNDMTTAGWVEAAPTHGDGQKVWGKENILVTATDPEFHLPDNVVRTTGNLPIININDPRYQFDRTSYSYKLY